MNNLHVWHISYLTNVEFLFNLVYLVQFSHLPNCFCSYLQDIFQILLCHLHQMDNFKLALTVLLLEYKYRIFLYMLSFADLI